MTAFSIRAKLEREAEGRDLLPQNGKEVFVMGRYVMKHTAAGFSFNLEAGNYEPILTSEVYNAEASCRNGIESVRTNAPIAEVEDQTTEGYAQHKNPKFEIYLDKQEQYRFRLKARNGEPIGKSEAYSSKAACHNGIDSVCKNADSPVIEKE